MSSSLISSVLNNQRRPTADNNRDTQISETAFQSGANTHAETGDQRPLLNWAISEITKLSVTDRTPGQFNIIERLIQTGVDTNSCSSYRIESPFTMVIRYTNEDARFYSLMDCMIKHGASLELALNNTIDTLTEKVIHFTIVERGDFETTKKVLNHSHLTEKNQAGHTLLEVAIKTGHTEIAEFLHQKGLEETNTLFSFLSKSVASMMALTSTLLATTSYIAPWLVLTPHTTLLATLCIINAMLAAVFLCFALWHYIPHAAAYLKIRMIQAPTTPCRKRQTPAPRSAYCVG